MVWAMIAKDKLVWRISNQVRNAKGVENALRFESMDGNEYRDNVLPLVLPWLKRNKIVFQQDGAPCHTQILSKDLIKKKGVKLMEDWPPRSPDLNPIENLWAIVQKRVSERCPQTIGELREAVDDIMRDISKNGLDIVNNLTKSFPKRCAKVFKQNGSF